MNGLALQWASQELRDDKDVVLVACAENGRAKQYISERLQNDKEYQVLLKAFRNYYTPEEEEEESPYEPPQLKIPLDEFEYIQLLPGSEPFSLSQSSQKKAVLNACSQNGKALRLVSDELQGDKQVVLVACSQNGNALQYASETLRSDKEVVMAAVATTPESLKFALGGLNQDRDCLIAAGLWDADHIERKTATTIKNDNDSNNNDNNNYNMSPPRKIVLSTKFSLEAESSPHATEFTVALKKNPDIANGNFVVYSPNAFNKGTCDPNWTDKSWPCRGTYSSCQKHSHFKRGVPQEADCCWRYSFRYHLIEASRSGGFMIQVVDYDWYQTMEHTLGNGQEIETEMAQEVGIKVFRFFEPKISRLLDSSYDDQIVALVSRINQWYNDGCRNMEECNVDRGTIEWA